MLKGIPRILPPDLLKVLCEMGHGDRIVIGDGNFPTQSLGKDAIVIRMDGHGACDVLEAILQVFPLDTYVPHPVTLMQVMPGDPVATPIWQSYTELVEEVDDRGRDAICELEKSAFYEEARSSYAIVATGENALYANLMLQKGIVTL